MKDLKKLLKSNEEAMVKMFFAMEMAEKGVSKVLEDTIKMIDEIPRDEVFDEDDSEGFMLNNVVSSKLDHMSWALMFKGFEKEAKEASKLISEELRKCADKLEEFYSSEKNK